MVKPRSRSSRRGTIGERRSGCPISIALELVGDPWSLLIVRDLAFGGARSFNDFLDAGEGIATNVLADRLRRLEKFGIIDRARNESDRRRFVYRLTGKGIDLAPVLVELVLWSARHEDTAAPAATVRRMGRDREGYLDEVRQAWKKALP